VYSRRVYTFRGGDLKATCKIASRKFRRYSVLSLYESVHFSYTSGDKKPVRVHTFVGYVTVRRKGSTAIVSPKNHSDMVFDAKVRTTSRDGVIAYSALDQ
jgi:hypothetical protein